MNKCKHEWRQLEIKNKELYSFYCIFCLADAIKENGHIKIYEK